MADDGGSTGVLREEADATGRALFRAEKAAVAAGSTRKASVLRMPIATYASFPVARDHALGNLLLTALEDACGSFPEAIAICGGPRGPRARRR